MAIKCRHCCELLLPDAKAANQPVAPAPSSDWRTPALILAITIVGLAALVAIIGMVTAIAVPQLMNAMDRGRQRRTIGNMLNFATANATMHDETGQYANSLADLAGYMQMTTFNDGWGNALIYRREGDGYSIMSLGSDGSVGPPPPRSWINDPYDPDIIMQNGQFTQAPQAGVKAMRKLPLVPEMAVRGVEGAGADGRAVKEAGT